VEKFEAIKSEAQSIDTTTNIGQAMFFAKLAEAWAVYDKLVEASPGMVAECRHRAQKHFALYLAEISC